MGTGGRDEDQAQAQVASAFVWPAAGLYGAGMGSDHEAEIRASVGAHHDLGPGYDDAVAEGLVERIGAEIDRRIEAQLKRYGPPSEPAEVPETAASPGPADPAESGMPRGYPAPPEYPPHGYVGSPGYPAPPGYIGPAGYPWYPGYQGPMPPPGYQAPMPLPGYQAPMPPPGYQAPAARPGSGSVGRRSVAMPVIALGSIGLGVLATAILTHAQYGGPAVLVLVVWVVIAIVNIAYSRRS
jgi:hypothetical protein